MPDSPSPTPAPQPPKEAMPPVQPLTPQPAPPTTPPPPKPPMVPPQAPPKPTPPPVPPPIPKPTPPPAPVVAAVPPTPPKPPEPSARPAPTPHDPSVHPHPEKKRHWVTLALIALIALILGGFAFLLVWPRLTNPTPAPTVTSTSPIPPDTSGGVIPPGGTGTTTSGTPPLIPATTSTPIVTDQPAVVMRGGTDVWFEGDVKTIRDPKTGKTWKIRVIGFGDSRCQPGVQCIWAGERTVTLDVTDVSTGQTERTTLGTSRATSVTILGLKLTLIAIDDGKGGVYAEIKAE